MLIILLNPPHSVCDNQEEIFRENVGKYFFIEPRKRKFIKTSRFVNYLNLCREGNSPGSCFDMFQVLRQLDRELSASNKECASEIGALREVKEAFWDSMVLITRLAWGEKPPETFMDRTGWLNQSDLALFCALKAQATRIYSAARWERFRERSLNELPGIENLPRNEAWSRTVISVNCKSYL